MPRWLRITVGAAALVAGCGATAAVLLPRLVLGYALKHAPARGVDVSIGAVQLGWLTATFDSVEVRLAGVDGVDALFSKVQVDVDRGLRPTKAIFGGGHLRISHAETLQADLERWRDARPTANGGTVGREPPAIAVTFDEAEVAMGGGIHIAATKVQVQRERGRTDVEIGSLGANAPSAAFRATDSRVSFDGISLRDAHASSAEVVWIDSEKSELGQQPVGTTVAPLLPPALDAPLSAKRGHKSQSTKEPPTPIPQLLPDLHLLRTALEAMIARAAAKVPGGSRIRVDALSVRFQKGEEQLTLGSGSFDLSRDAHGIAVGFSTSPVAHGTPLSLHAMLPTEPSDIEVSVSGGPVPLGLLGMHDGGLLHLLDVDRTSFAGKARIVLDAGGHTLTFDVEGSVRGLSMLEPKLAHDPVRGMDLGFSTRGVVDDSGALRLDNAEASLGSARATLHGGLTQSLDHLAAAFDFDFPTSSCQALLTSIPTALVPTVSAARMDGTFSLRGRLAVDSRNLDAIAFDYDVSDHCRLVDVPTELDKGRFARSFTHIVYSKTGERTEETTGPGTPNWTDLDEISPYMQVAVLTTEDGAFFHHHGFNHSAIRHAVAANIKAHRFVRGASTITMQLAKNLFLAREKTLARKLEELVLADYLEQAFTKDEMMELYLNIIEFGPDLYGVTAAAEHYFGRRPNELNLAECMFLSSILPNPIAFHKVYDDGQLGDGWMRTIRARMDVASRTGLISSAELTEGLAEAVVFHRAGAPPPTPRPPVSTPSHPAASKDWEELN